MSRGAFISGVTVSLLAAPLAAQAQRSETVYHIDRLHLYGSP
jgi:hypothetical protein